MYRVTVCYGQPTDPAAFDSHYAQTHTPLVRLVPGLAGFSGGRCASLDRSDPAYYFVAFLDFASMIKAAPALVKYQAWRSVYSIVSSFVKSVNAFTKALFSGES